MAVARSRAGSKRPKARGRRSGHGVLVKIAWGLAAVLFIGLFLFSLTEGDDTPGVAEPEAWDLPALDGNGRVALVDFKGKPTVAAFFASWCHICQRELPGFAQLEAGVGDQVNFVGINTMNNGSGLSFAQQAGIGGWPLARDIGMHDGRELATNFGARGSPTTVIYDSDGRVVDVTLGGMTASQLAGKLNQLFGITA